MTRKIATSFIDVLATARHLLSTNFNVALGLPGTHPFKVVIMSMQYHVAISKVM